MPDLLERLNTALAGRYARSQVLVLLLVSTACAQSDLASNPDPVPRVRELLEHVSGSGQLVGFQVAVAQDGRMILSQSYGYADLEHEVPVNPETRFAIASVTKAVTAFTLLQLSDLGRIDPDAPIQDYVPEYPKKDRVVTARLLAANRSGIPHYPRERTWEWYQTHYYTHYDDIVAAIGLFKDEPLGGAPGEFSYSSYGYNLLASAIQRASGERFQAYVESQVLAPMGIERTTFADVRRILPNRTRMYSQFVVKHGPREPAPALNRIPENWDYSYNAGGGGLWSTAEDLVQFGQGFLASEHASPVLEFYRETDGGFYFGWWGGVTGDHISFRAQGGVIGSYADLRIFPDAGVVVAFVTNTESALNTGQLTNVIGRTVIEGLGDPVLLFEAETAYSSRRWQDAAIHFAEAVKADLVHDPSSWYKLARSHHSLGDYAAAIPAYRSAVQNAAHPMWRDNALYRLAGSLAADGRVTEAVQALERLREEGNMEHEDWALLGSDPDFQAASQNPELEAFLETVRPKD